jgi:aspartate/glutamate racemase
MKVLGLIGGMSWESSAHYYRLINEGVRAARSSASAQCILWSFDFPKSRPCNMPGTGRSVGAYGRCGKGA